jgi:hypothetical protein
VSGDQQKEFGLAARLRFRDELRAGRARTQRNAEGFGEIVRTVERLAQFMGASGNGLGHYRNAVAGLATASPLALEIPSVHRLYLEPFDVLYESTRRGRNLSVHEGAYARNVATHAVQLALVLEDAMQATMTTVQDFMVRFPTCAEPWEPIALIRQKMLVNSFSFLPMYQSEPGEWRLISDLAIARYLPREDFKARKKMLATRVEKAIAEGLELLPAAIVQHDRLVADMINDLADRPVLVAGERPGQILGILTAFDLL